MAWPENGNLVSERNIIKGDIEKGFAQADIIVEKTYRTSIQEHLYLEPDAGTAWIDTEGRYAFYASTQK